MFIFVNASYSKQEKIIFIKSCLYMPMFSVLEKKSFNFLVIGLNLN